MRSKTAGRSSVLLFGLLGFVLGLIVLRYRNIYEDEWMSLSTIHKPLRVLWAWGNTRDWHPPGAHALDRLLLLVVGSARGLAAVHLTIWSAGVLWFTLSARRLLASGWGRADFAALAFLHPQALMWNSSIRWYPIWWSVALAMVSAALLPARRDAAPRWPVAVALGVAGGLLVYYDYLTLLFLPCLAVAWLVRHGPGRVSLARLVALGVVAAGVASPQLRHLTHDVIRTGHGTMAPLLMAAARSAYALSIGQAILPWHPMAALVVLGLVLPAAGLFLRGLPERWRELAQDPPAERELAALLTFLALMLASEVASGVASHSYSLIGLVPFVALLLASGAERARARAWRVFATLVAVAWVALGAQHLVARTGTAKRQFNDHPDEYIARLEELAGGRPALVITDDLVFTFEINQRRSRGGTPLVVASCYDDQVHGVPPGLHVDPMTFATVFDIEHPEGESGEFGIMANRALARTRGMLADSRTVDLGLDPDWRIKIRIAGAHIAAARLRVWYGRPLAGDWAAVGRQLELAGSHSILGEGPGGGSR
jgi:hypothetical protein